MSYKSFCIEFTAVLSSLEDGQYYMVSKDYKNSKKDSVIGLGSFTKEEATKAFLAGARAISKQGTSGIHIRLMRKDVKRLGGVTPVLAWSSDPNTNFTWATGPTYYLDYDRTAARRAASKNPTLFLKRDWLKV